MPRRKKITEKGILQIAPEYSKDMPEHPGIENLKQYQYKPGQKKPEGSGRKPGTILTKAKLKEINDKIESGMSLEDLKPDLIRIFAIGVSDKNIVKKATYKELLNIATKIAPYVMPQKREEKREVDIKVEVFFNR